MRLLALLRVLTMPDSEPESRAEPTPVISSTVTVYGGTLADGSRVERRVSPEELEELRAQGQVVQGDDGWWHFVIAGGSGREEPEGGG